MLLNYNSFRNVFQVPELNFFARKFSQSIIRLIITVLRARQPLSALLIPFMNQSEMSGIDYLLICKNVNARVKCQLVKIRQNFMDDRNKSENQRGN